MRNRPPTRPERRNILLAVSGIVALLIVVAGVAAVARTGSTSQGPGPRQPTPSKAAEGPFSSPGAAADPMAIAADPLTYVDSAGRQQPCFKRLDTHIGTHAASVAYAFGACPGNHGGAGGAVYVYEDGTGWHAYTVMASQNGALPGQEGVGFYGLAAGHGCMRVRQGPTLVAPIVICLDGGQPLATAGLPTWADGHIWYQVRVVNPKDLAPAATLGWSMLDYLVCQQPPRPGAARAPDC